MKFSLEFCNYHKKSVKFCITVLHSVLLMHNNLIGNTGLVTRAISSYNNDLTRFFKLSRQILGKFLSKHSHKTSTNCSKNS